MKPVTEPRWVWIDQLCIDQSNNLEKASQVSAMDRLYKSAVETIIWLGPDPHDGVAFSTMRQILDFCAYVDHHGVEHAGQDQGDGEARDLVLSAGQRGALTTLERNPYWGRHWITQEVVLSRKRTLWYGDDAEADFLSLFMMNHLIDGGGRVKNAGWSTTQPIWYLMQVEVCVNPASPALEVEPFEVWRNSMALAKKTGCFDKRDKVYGVQSLFGGEYRIAVDYSVSVEGVLRQALALYDRVIVPEGQWSRKSMTSAYFSLVKGMGFGLRKGFRDRAGLFWDGYGRRGTEENQKALMDMLDDVVVDVENMSVDEREAVRELLDETRYG